MFKIGLRRAGDEPEQRGLAGAYGTGAEAVCEDEQGIGPFVFCPADEGVVEGVATACPAAGWCSLQLDALANAVVKLEEGDLSATALKSCELAPKGSQHVFGYTGGGVHCNSEALAATQAQARGPSVAFGGAAVAVFEARAPVAVQVLAQEVLPGQGALCRGEVPQFELFGQAVPVVVGFGFAQFFQPALQGAAAVALLPGGLRRTQPFEQRQGVKFGGPAFHSKAVQHLPKGRGQQALVRHG